METQFGSGLNGGSTEVAHLMLKAYFDYASAKKQMMGALFVDISTAFAAMVRSVIFPMPASDEVLLKKLADRGFSIEDIRALVD